MSARPAVVAIDLGAESCRVSLLQSPDGRPEARMVHRFANGPYADGPNLRWDLHRICRELEDGLRQCAKLAPEGIASVGVTGWAVDYVRLNAQGQPLAQPYCYRDARTQDAMHAAHERLSAERLYSITGIQIQPINTVYQLYADARSGVRADTPWVTLPEYILYWLGAPRVAEYTNASHTGLLDAETRRWSDEVMEALGLSAAAAPELVAPGSVLGPLRHDLRALPAFEQTQLIAPACHDTASAIGGIAVQDDEWAYISSGTWSLVGTLLPVPHKTADACAQGFTNLGAATGEILFHRGIPGMWLLRQCMQVWEKSGPCSIASLIDDARKLPKPKVVLDLDDGSFLLPGNMPERMQEQLRARGLAALPTGCEAAPHYANLIFHSLAARYASLLQSVRAMTGKSVARICVAGGGSRNEYLNRLTANATGLPVARCSAESSTLGNFAVQWARLENESAPIDASLLGEYARRLQNAISMEA